MDDSLYFFTDLKKYLELYEFNDSSKPNHKTIINKDNSQKNTKIDRKTITVITDQIKLICYKYFKTDQLSIDVCGSYRRCKRQSNDIDLLFCNLQNKESKTGIQNKSITLTQIINLLTEQKILTFHITDPQKITKVYMGYINEMRIDIKICDKESYIFSLMKFTGSKFLNIKLSAIAKNKGLILNEYGLFDRKTREKVLCDPKIEQDVYDYLELPYLEPFERSYIYI
jgi:DNA polymerase/3'-5' exonuclease PolX